MSSKRAAKKRERRNAISKAKRRILRALGMWATRTKCIAMRAGAKALDDLVLRRMARGTMARACVYPFMVRS